jgi:hypothetical protein
MIVILEVDYGQTPSDPIFYVLVAARQHTITNIIIIHWKEK